VVIRTPAPRLELVPDPHERKRVLLTVSCTDADSIPKVSNAGEIARRGEYDIQVMHNGVVIREGCYGGPWMTEIIRSLHGHHEPQEEIVFDTMIRRLLGDTEHPVMIEFGSFWTYYGMWFAQELPRGRVIALEPDPNNLKVGELNAELNELRDRITFVHGAIGDEPGQTLEFVAESDQQAYTVTGFDLASLMRSNSLEHVDLALVDVQGAETLLLDRARADLMAGRVRFMLVSTHHHSISGSALTHQRTLAYLLELGAHVIAEHSVPESFSGDGLIAVSFDPRDADLVVPISLARSKDSLFDEVEYELDDVQNRLAGMTRQRDQIVQSRLWRASAPLRRGMQRIRRA
jgi:FkbM family methyltransferase